MAQKSKKKQHGSSTLSVMASILHNNKSRSSKVSEHRPCRGLSPKRPSAAVQGTFLKRLAEAWVKTSRASVKWLGGGAAHGQHREGSLNGERCIDVNRVLRQNYPHVRSALRSVLRLKPWHIWAALCFMMSDGFAVFEAS